MAQTDAPKLPIFSSLGSATGQSPTTISGHGYVSTGPLTSQRYELAAPIAANEYQFKVMLLGDSGVGKSTPAARNDLCLIVLAGQAKRVYSYASTTARS